MHEQGSDSMSVTLTQLDAWLAADEGEHLEFKEAKNRFDFEKLVQYCVALANERGGQMILGVTDKKPRRVVGTQAFENLERTKAGLLERLNVRVAVDVVLHPDGRVLVFSVPSRPIATPIQYKGAYWMRGGEDLVPMTPDVLRRIFHEAEPDFSALVCTKATLDDLDAAAIDAFRARWQQYSKNAALSHLSHEQLLKDAELMTDAGLTYAALILFGTYRALGQHLNQAEVIFEYRSKESAISSLQREDYRLGFFVFHDDLWHTINLRNDKYHFIDGLFARYIPSFDETAVREAILNAVTHRDYRHTGSVFVRQYPTYIEIVSPGGLPQGITPDNILWQQNPPNRRLAETFARCGLVERAGQGVNRMFAAAIREAKQLPDYTLSDDFQVFLRLYGEVQDPDFLRFLSKIGKELSEDFSNDDLLVLDRVKRELKIPEQIRYRLQPLRDCGAIERIGRKYILSRRFYAFVGQKGVYTRKRGLDRETNKQLLLKHIRDNKKTGSKFEELQQVLPTLTRRQIQKLLEELKKEEQIHVQGRTKAALWFPGTESEGNRENDS